MNPYSSLLVEELIGVCAESNDADAWREFVARFHRDISLAIIRTAHRWGIPPRELIDDLVQETYLKICADKCRLLNRFAVEHPESVTGYVKTVAINIAHDYFKSRQSRKRGGGATVQLHEELEPRASSENFGGQEAMEREILLRQIDHCLHECTEGPSQARDRVVFWLYYQQGMTAKAIAALPTIELTAKGVESVILRLTRIVREKMCDQRVGLPHGSGLGTEGLRQRKSY